MLHFMIVLVQCIKLNLSWIIKCLFLRNVEPLSCFDTKDLDIINKLKVPLKMRLKTIKKTHVFYGNKSAYYINLLT